MAKVFKNENGSDYLILDTRGESALLARIGDESNATQFIIASVMSVHSWTGGNYYKTLQDALVAWDSRLA